MKIRLFQHVFAPAASQEFEADSLALWLLDHYGDSPSVNVQVFAGEPSGETEITGNVQAILTADGQEYTVLESPGGPLTTLFVVVAVIAVAAVLLMPKPALPSNVNRTQSSNNNSLSSRENELRMLERVEDIYGTVLSVPSLMMPTYNKYHAHTKYEYGYYCVGRGYYDISDVLDGDTLIAETDGASASVYAPFTSPNSGHAPQIQIGDAIIDDVLTVSRSVEIDGVTLQAHNQVQLAESGQYSYTQSGSNGVIAQKEGSPAMDAVCEADTTVTVVMDDFLVMTDPGTPGDPLAVPPIEYVPPTYVHYNYSGTYSVIAVGDRSITVSGVTWPVAIPWETVETFPPFGAIVTPIYSSVQIDDVTEYTDWITLPDTDRTEVWCNILAQNGMYKDEGDGKIGAAVAFAIEIEKLNDALEPLGVVETVSGSISGKVADERAETVEHATSWTGPARVRMRRTTGYDYGFDGTVIDEIKWADLYSVSPVTRTEFGNKTTIQTITKATTRATSLKSRQLNCIASRKLPIYNGSTFSGAFDSDGRHVSGTISATSKLCDIIAAVSVDPKIGARDLATEIDMPQIYGIQQQLDAWNTDCGQFNYTFDTDNFSFEETIISIANAGFCIAYRQNGKIRLALDKAQPTSSALFTHRNKKPNSETITRTFSSDSDYDGVEFVYVDPDSQQSETIILPLDGNYTKLKKFEIAGIRHFSQAWLRANREYRKLMGQRVTIETTTTSDARLLLPNSRVDIVDNTRFQSYDGEVVGQNGLELTLSRDVQFTTGLPHSIVLMKRDGSLQSIPVAEGSAPNRVLLQNLPSEAVVTRYGQDGIRTIYSFAADSARGSQAYLVQELDITDPQYVKITAVNYSDGYYAMDNATIPDRDSIINNAEE